MKRSSPPRRRAARKKPGRKPGRRAASKVAGLASARRLQTAHVKRRQAHTSSLSRRRQARRDSKPRSRGRR